MNRGNYVLGNARKARRCAYHMLFVVSTQFLAEEKKGRTLLMRDFRKTFVSDIGQRKHRVFPRDAMTDIRYNKKTVEHGLSVSDEKLGFRHISDKGEV